MLCHRHRCLFVHIPKTGGRSIQDLFLERRGLTWAERGALLLRPNPRPNDGPPRLAHLTAAEYIRCGHVDPETFRCYFKFSFVRDPWTRLLSEFFFRDYHRRMDFRTFLFDEFPTPADDDYLIFDDRHRHVVPQTRFLVDDHDRLLVDFVGRYERLDQDFRHVCDRIGFAPAPLPRANRAPVDYRGQVRALIDPECRARIAELYARDIARFGYDFDEVADRLAAAAGARAVPVTPVPAAAAAAGRWPDFLGLGAPRAGTTSICRVLRGHPALFVPEPTEVHYFSYLRFGCRGRAEVLAAKKAWYRGLFAAARPDQPCGELSPSYLWFPTAPEEIATSLPRVRAFVCLRDPVARTLSAFRHAGVVDPAALDARVAEGAAAVAAARVSLDGAAPSAIVYQSLYRRHLTQWRAVLPADRLAILPYARLVKDPEAFFAQLTRFLAVAPPVPAGGPAHADRAAPVPEPWPATIDRLRRLYADELCLMDELFGADADEAEPGGAAPTSRG